MGCEFKFNDNSGWSDCTGCMEVLCAPLRSAPLRIVLLLPAVIKISGWKCELRIVNRECECECICRTLIFEEKLTPVSCLGLVKSTLMARVFVTFRLHNININFAIYPARPAPHCCHCVGIWPPKRSLITSESIRSKREQSEHPHPAPSYQLPVTSTQHLSAFHFSSIPCTFLLPFRTMELRETETSTGRMRNAHNAKD